MNHVPIWEEKNWKLFWKKIKNKIIFFPMKKHYIDLILRKGFMKINLIFQMFKRLSVFLFFILYKLANNHLSL